MDLAATFGKQDIYEQNESKMGWMSIKRKEDRVRNRTMIKILGLVSLLSLLVIASVLAGCGGKETATPATTPSPTTARSEYVIEVFQSFDKIASLSLSDLQSLPQKSVQTTAGVQEGPALVDVLEQAGIQEFSEVMIFGLTEDRNFAEVLTLSREKVNEQVVLGVTEQGKTILASPDIPDEKWIYDVNRLSVE